MIHQAIPIELDTFFNLCNNYPMITLIIRDLNCLWFILFLQDKRAPLAFTLAKTVDYISPWHLLRFTAVKNLTVHQNKLLSKLGLIYFLYLFIYSGLEFTITFLTHHTFNYTAMQQGKMFLVIGKSSVYFRCINGVLCWCNSHAVFRFMCTLYGFTCLLPQRAGHSHVYINSISV